MCQLEEISLDFLYGCQKQMVAILQVVGINYKKKLRPIVINVLTKDKIVFVPSKYWEKMCNSLAVTV